MMMKKKITSSQASKITLVAINLSPFQRTYNFQAYKCTIRPTCASRCALLHGSNCSIPNVQKTTTTVKQQQRVFAPNLHCVLHNSILNAQATTAGCGLSALKTAKNIQQQHAASNKDMREIKNGQVGRKIKFAKIAAEKHIRL